MYYDEQDDPDLPDPNERRRCTRCGGFLPFRGWSRFEKRAGRGHPDYYENHATGEVTIYGEEFELYSGEEILCRRCGHKNADTWQPYPARVEYVKYDVPRIIANACKVYELEPPENPDHAPDYSEASPYEFDDLPF